MIISSAIILVTVTVALYLALRRDWQSNPLPPPRTLSQLTFDPGLASEPAWSPDGRFIAYSSDKSGNFDIWVQPVGGGDAGTGDVNPLRTTGSRTGRRTAARLCSVPSVKAAGCSWCPHWAGVSGKSRRSATVRDGLPMAHEDSLLERDPRGAGTWGRQKSMWCRSTGTPPHEVQAEFVSERVRLTAFGRLAS